MTGEARGQADVAISDGQQIPFFSIKRDSSARNARTVDQAMQNNRWMLDIQGCVATLGARECVRRAALSAVRRNANTPDNFTWPWTVSGVYTAASVYHMFMQGNIMFDLAEAIWNYKTTPKSKFFS
jgi:hypothetical protein